MDAAGPAEDETTSAIRAVWDSAADRYSTFGVDSSEAQGEAWQRLLSRVLPPTRPLRVIDVGCGPGPVAIPLAELGHEVIGVDLSAEMLRACRTEADARGLTGLRLVHGRAEDLPDEVGTADAVISRHLLWTLPRPEDAVRSWVDRIAPSGRVLAVDSLWSPQLIRQTGGHYADEIQRLLPLLHARDLEPTRNVWRRAGLHDVLVEELAWIDDVMRTHAPPDARETFDNLSFYLVESTKPVVSSAAG